MTRILLSIVCATAGAGEAASPAASGWDRGDKALALNAAVVAGFTAYGIAFWEHGESDPKVYHEGWFGADTLHGGMDKLGHAYTNLVGATIFSEIYEDFGYDPRPAAWMGGASMFGTTLLMEVGDSFSPAHGFSPEDVVFNALGSSWSVLRREVPALARLVDFRLEYWPSSAVTSGAGEDFSTDYAGQRYLLAFKGSAFSRDLNLPALRFLELHLGYYARGFEPTDRAGPPERTLYFGFGFNLGEVFDWAFSHRAGGVFTFYQPPYTSWRVWERSR